jgi:hypothetical protein
MTLKLEELGQLVRTVARERRLDAEVLGVTPTEGDGHYAEVLIDLSNTSSAAERVSLGFQRDAAVQDLRRQIASGLDMVRADTGDRT